MASFKYTFDDQIMVARYASTDDVFRLGKIYGIFGIGMPYPGDEELRVLFRESLEFFRESKDYFYTGYGLVVPAGTEVEVQNFSDPIEVLVHGPDLNRVPVFEFPESVIEFNRTRKETT